MRVNVYNSDGVRLWLQFVLSDWNGDFLLEACEDDYVGTTPEWWEEDADLESALDFQYGSFNKAAWALKKGLCPRQAFMVFIPLPKNYKIWTDYGYEYDVKWDCDIVFKEEIAPEVAVSRWDRYLKWRRLFFETRDRNQESAKQIQFSNYAAMRLEWDVYGWVTSFPNGSVVKLVSNYHGFENDVPGGRVNPVITEGRSDEGDREEALANLIKNAYKLQIPGEVVLHLYAHKKGSRAPPKLIVVES